MIIGDYIYLHFMDRELRGSIGNVGRISDDTAKKWVKMALFMSDMPLYVSLSHMYESHKEFPNTVKFIFELEKVGIIQMVSNHSNPDDFLESRKNMYSFDKDRYEQYFNDNELIWPTNLHNDKKGTTEYLKKEILTAEDIFVTKKVEDSIKTSLLSNVYDGITIQRFIPLIEKAVEDNNFFNVTTSLRVAISRFYTKRYLDSYGGTIVTGLPSFDVYDDLAKSPVYTDYRLFDLLVNNILYLQNNDDERFVAYLVSDEFKMIKRICRFIVEYVYTLFCNGEPFEKILVEIRGLIDVNSNKSDNTRLFTIHNYLKAECAERRLEVIIKENIFLVVVATQLELQSLLAIINQKYNVETKIGAENYFTTSINGNIVYIVKSQMGVSGPGGSTLTTDDAIKYLNPDIIIMCGIAWGGKSDSQKVGDVLISTKVWEYDLVKKTEDDEISRGNIMPASPQLIQSMEMIAALENKINTHFGMIASGSVLFNNKNEVEKLKTKQPELIGGEMEISGVASSCQRNNKKWIMIKGICDWGYEKDSDNKEKYQKLAAENSVNILVQFLERYSDI